ncbi:MAG TPA: NAD(P)-dependent alcohol dehydrogenase [Gaiellaceae bacterium]|jgi:NADPH:quinone reductase-like Zn-dependent oxidoreductase|nr:NAD(P)-dependent alcohol dehydrogenase [Gaiellaceae bacterium]
MRAAVRERYGTPTKVVEIRELERPVPADDEVLVRVRAASTNIADWYDVTGRPKIARFTTGLRRPKELRLGVDYAGVVEAVGKDVTDFAPGDEVFGGRTGAFADYVVAKADRAIVHKPENVPFEDAAAAPVAAITALEAIRDRGGLVEGQKVLVHGASGGVGTYAVQVAKALGASRVTAVCSAPNVEIARSLGADRVVDYGDEDCTVDDDRYDLLVDIAGTRPFRQLRRVLTPAATVVVVGGPRKNRLLGPLGHVVRTKAGALVTSQSATFFVARLDKAKLETIRDLLARGELRSVIDSTFGLEDVARALEHQGSGHPRGKIVVAV